MDNAPDILVSLIPLIEALEELEVAYHIGGSEPVRSMVFQD